MNIYKKLLVCLGFESNGEVFRKYDIVVSFNDTHCTVSQGENSETFELDEDDHNAFSGAYGMVRSPYEYYCNHIIECLINAKGLRNEFNSYINGIADRYFQGLVAFVLYETNHYDEFAIEMYGTDHIFDINIYNDFLQYTIDPESELTWVIDLIESLD